MTVQSTLRRTDGKIECVNRKKAELEMTPPIDFWSTLPEEVEKDADKHDHQKDLHVTVSVPLDLSDDSPDAKTHEAKVKAFETGTPEEFCAHRDAVDEIATELGHFHHARDAQGRVVDEDGNPMSAHSVADWEAKAPIPLAQSTLCGNAGHVFDAHAQRNKGELDPRQAHKMAWTEVADTIFQHSRDAAKVQQRHSREGGLKFCGQHDEPHEFAERLDLVNEHIPHFPLVQRPGTDIWSRGKSLEDDDSIDVMDKARTNVVRTLMLQSGDHSRKCTEFTEHARALQDWHNNVKLTEALKKKDQAIQGTTAPSEKQNKRKNNESDSGERASKRSRTSDEGGNKKPCRHCGKTHPGSDNKCWSLDKNKSNRPEWCDSPRKRNNTQSNDNGGKSHNKKEFNQAVSRAVLKATKQIEAQLIKKKSKKTGNERSRHDDSDDESGTKDDCAMKTMRDVMNELADNSDSAASSSQSGNSTSTAAKASSLEVESSEDDLSTSSDDVSLMDLAALCNRVMNHPTLITADCFASCAFCESSRKREKHAPKRHGALLRQQQKSRTSTANWCQFDVQLTLEHLMAWCQETSSNVVAPKALRGNQPSGTLWEDIS